MRYSIWSVNSWGVVFQLLFSFEFYRCSCQFNAIIKFIWRVLFCEKALKTHKLRPTWNHSDAVRTTKPPSTGEVMLSEFWWRFKEGCMDESNWLIELSGFIITDQLLLDRPVFYLFFRFYPVRLFEVASHIETVKLLTVVNCTSSGRTNQINASLQNIKDSDWYKMADQCISYWEIWKYIKERALR